MKILDTSKVKYPHLDFQGQINQYSSQFILSTRWKVFCYAESKRKTELPERKVCTGNLRKLSSGSFCFHHSAMQAGFFLKAKYPGVLSRWFSLVDRRFEISYYDLSGSMVNIMMLEDFNTSFPSLVGHIWKCNLQRVEIHKVIA